jgi:Mor family transcriptional regulator
MANSTWGNDLPCIPLWGTTLYTLEQATNRVLQQLYRGFSLSKAPVSRRRNERNAEIRARYVAGMSVPELAQQYGISEQRIHQILRGKRK